MSTYMALRDRRLQGGVPARPSLRIANVDGNTPLSSAFGSITAAARSGGRINTLFIFCHGYAGSNRNAQMSMDAGGMGLQLGRENVLHTNVGMWTSIRNKVDNIVVYSCAASNTEQGNQGTTADGKYLMGALALHTNATVFAADRIQWYSTYNGASNGRFEFGEWEGQLWEFPPDGTSPIPRDNAPVEFSDVMAGTAP
jgi:hypothetical protein